MAEEEEEQQQQQQQVDENKRIRPRERARGQKLPEILHHHVADTPLLP